MKTKKQCEESMKQKKLFLWKDKQDWQILSHTDWKEGEDMTQIN
jgi:hypothetical protein